MLDPRLLRSFVVLAEDLHFGHAAERLNLAQPALSQQIRRLERQVGVNLFTRSSRIVELTDAGRAMLEPARASLRAAAQAERAAQEAAKSSVRPLRVGVEMSLEDVVPTVLAHARTHRDVALWLSRLHEPHGQEALATSQIDAFIGFLPPAEGTDVRGVRTIDIPLSAVLRPDHPLARRAAVPLEAFRQSPIAIFEREQSPRLFDRYVDILSEGEGRQALSLRELSATGTGSEVAVLAEVDSGEAISFGTSATMAMNARHLRRLPFDPPLSISTYLSWHVSGSKAVDDLVGNLRHEEASAEIQDAVEG